MTATVGFRGEPLRVLRPWIITFILLLLIPVTQLEAADGSVLNGIGVAERTVKDKPAGDPFTRCRKKLVRYSLIFAALTIPSSVAMPWVYHEIAANVAGKDHAGHGIYIDMERIREVLTAEERLLLDDPETNRDALIAMFTDKLHGDWIQDPFFSLAPEPRDATSFFKGQSESRGCCRQKASVLAAILNKLGIRAELETGYSGDELHVWVYLSDLDQIADPVHPTVQDANEYRKNHINSYIRMRLVPKGWW